MNFSTINKFYFLIINKNLTQSKLHVHCANKLRNKVSLQITITFEEATSMIERKACGQNIIGRTIDSTLAKPPHLLVESRKCIALLTRPLISNSNVTDI